MLQVTYPLTSAIDIERMYGTDFAQGLLDTEPGSWQGPVLSGYGQHLVYVTERVESALPAFAEVQDRVQADWFEDHRKKTNERFYETLSARYEVIIDDDVPQ